MIQNAKNGRFHQLRLKQRRFDRQKRFEREHNRAFRNGIDVAREFEVFKRSQKFLVKAFKTSQIFDVRFFEMKIFDVLHNLLEACGYDVAEFGSAAIKNVENGLSVGSAALKITVHHGELVKVGKKC